MRTPTVTEISRRPDPVVHDTFIDDLAPVRRGTTGKGLAAARTRADRRRVASFPSPRQRRRDAVSTAAQH